MDTSLYDHISLSNTRPGSVTHNFTHWTVVRPQQPTPQTASIAPSYHVSAQAHPLILHRGVVASPFISTLRPRPPRSPPLHTLLALARHRHPVCKRGTRGQDGGLVYFARPAAPSPQRHLPPHSVLASDDVVSEPAPRKTSRCEQGGGERGTAVWWWHGGAHPLSGAAASPNSASAAFASSTNSCATSLDLSRPSSLG